MLQSYFACKVNQGLQCLDSYPPYETCQTTLKMVTLRAPSFVVRRVCVFIFLGVMGYSIFQMTRSNSNYDPSDRNGLLKQIELEIRSTNDQEPMKNMKNEKYLACPHPVLDPFDRVMMSFVKDEPPLVCSEEKNWVVVKGNIARITDEALKKYGDIQCKFMDVLRANEYATSLGVVTTTHTEYNLETSDFFRVYCESENGQQSWESRMAGIRFDEDVINRAGWDRVPKDGLGLNVLMLGLDSLSNMMVQRRLPKVYSKLKSMGAYILEGYNIVGDGTPQALIPILTGRTELELPDTRKRMGNKASYMDVYPFIWKEFMKYGYVTGFAEDVPDIGTFTYRLKGFDEQPTDHYLRTYYVDAKPMFSQQKPFCYGSMPRHQIMLNYAKDMFRVYEDKPKFMFAFHGELSHDYANRVAVAEQDLVEWFEWFEKSGYLNNTMLVFMSDHGQRFAKVRDTQQGKLEERMPFFSFVLPKWFSRKNPKMAANMKINTKRLTTPFDIYSTLMTVLHKDWSKTGDDSKKRSISLFDEVPLQRTCRDAYIEPHWCACLNWQPIDVQSQLATEAAKHFVQFLNTYNSRYTDLCESIEIDRIEWANKMAPNDGLLKFHQAADTDGFVPDMTSNTKITSVYLQLKVITLPAHAIFEFSSQYNSNTNEHTVCEKDISRINKYGNQSWCIAESQPQLNKYCYCKQQN